MELIVLMPRKASKCHPSLVIDFGQLVNYGCVLASALVDVSLRAEKLSSPFSLSTNLKNAHFVDILYVARLCSRLCIRC